MQVWKSPLEVTDSQVLELPAGAQLLSVQVQHGSPQIWALVDPSLYTEPRQIRIVGTGHSAADVGRFIDTFQVQGGSLVFHVFEAGEVR